MQQDAEYSEDNINLLDIENASEKFWIQDLNELNTFYLTKMVKIEKYLQMIVSGEIDLD